jgi:hypothetical protein
MFWRNISRPSPESNSKRSKKPEKVGLRQKIHSILIFKYRLYDRRESSVHERTTCSKENGERIWGPYIGRLRAWDIFTFRFTGIGSFRIRATAIHPPISILHFSMLGLHLHEEDGGITLLRNVGKYLSEVKILLKIVGIYPQTTKVQNGLTKG